jgi:hypothetical protein
MKPLNFESDAAENSIMQTITIAVSAILIAAGLVTAPGLINNARDNNTTGDLANLAYAQEFQLSDTGKYAATLSDIQANSSGDNKIKLTLSSKSVLGMVTGSDCYALFGQSSSGNYFIRTSASANTIAVGKTWSTTKPAGYPANCAYPTTAVDALGSKITNLATNGSLESGNTDGYNGYYGGPLSTTTEDHYGSTGTTSLKLTTNSSVQNQPQGMIYETPNASTIGGAYVGSAWIKCAAGVKADFGFRVDNSQESSPDSFTCTGNWERHSIQYNINGLTTAGASGVQFRYIGIPPVGTTAYFDDIQIESGTVLHDYIDGSSTNAKWDGVKNNSTATGYSKVS